MDAGIPDNNSFIRADTVTALFYGLHNLTYEGGPGNTSFTVTGDTSGAIGKALATSVQMAPGMKNDVIQGLTNAFANGIDMYMYYENESATYWGATTDPLDLNAPKFAGLAAMPGQLVTRTVGTTLPATIPVNPPDLTISNGIIPTAAWQVMFCSNDGCSLKNTATPGTGFGYLVNVPKTGNYSFSLTLSPNGTPNGSIALDVDQKSVGSFTVAQSSGGTAQTVGPVNTMLTSGLHLIEILQVGNYNFAANSIAITAN